MFNQSSIQYGWARINTAIFCSFILPHFNCFTFWGQVTHICLNKLTGLSLFYHIYDFICRCSAFWLLILCFWFNFDLRALGLQTSITKLGCNMQGVIFENEGDEYFHDNYDVYTFGMIYSVLYKTMKHDIAYQFIQCLFNCVRFCYCWFCWLSCLRVCADIRLSCFHVDKRTYARLHDNHVHISVQHLVEGMNTMFPSLLTITLTGVCHPVVLETSTNIQTHAVGIV